jgi:multisubunit Na+/H+ antiporter MnhB subunit
VPVLRSIPILSEVELVSTIAFDLGVFCAVVGAVMTTLIRIGEFNRHETPHPVDPTVPLGEGEDPWNP